MSGSIFRVHRTTGDALQHLFDCPLSFMNSEWLDTHMQLLRAAPALVLLVFHRVTPWLHEALEHAFPAGAPVRCSTTGVPMSGPRDPAAFVRRRRELLVNALASTTLGVRAQMLDFELDLRTPH